jgi:flavin reductase (DIM6/NTAB) family NADH-FMN oxidoreductase RutF
MPVTIVGANVQGKPNYAVVAHVGIFNYSTPQYISVGLNKSHFTNQGIKDNGTFSVCIPSDDMAVVTDYVGIVSGKKIDKSNVFRTFYGELGTAPMIEECPVCMECKLFQKLDFKTHDVFVGELITTYCDDDVLTDGKIDQTKVRPILFDMDMQQYWKLGDPIGKAWHIGKKMIN